MIGTPRMVEASLYLISTNEHYQLEMIQPWDVEILGRCEIRIGRIF